MVNVLEVLAWIAGGAILGYMGWTGMSIVNLQRTMAVSNSWQVRKDTECLGHEKWLHATNGKLDQLLVDVAVIKAAHKNGDGSDKLDGLLQSVRGLEGSVAELRAGFTSKRAG